MIPGTKYQTKEDIELSIKEENAKSFILPKYTSFLISIWNSPYTEFLIIDLDKTTLNQLQKRNSFPLSAKSFQLTSSQIQDQCELITDFSEAIYFYSPHESWGEFSNFAEFGFEYEGLFYPTVEHFYQSQKFEDQAYSTKIRLADTPKQAAELGKTRVLPLRADWEAIKEELMMTAVTLKFENDSELKALLLMTEDILLIENSPYDNYWGIGRAGKGLNRLGTILMRVRERLGQSSP